MSPEQQRPEGFRGWWPHIRTALILFHICAVCLMAFPAPQGALQKSSWDDPSVKNEMHMWAERSRSIGFTWNDVEFRDFLWDASKAILEVRRWVLWPFMPYMNWTGARQSWRMFSAPHRYPVRLFIEVEQDGIWRPVYVGRSDEYTWMRDTFDHHRIRRIIFLHGWKRYDRRWSTFGKWIARHAAEDFPDATRVRIRQWKFRTPSPEELRDGKREIGGKFQRELRFDLQGYR